MNPSGCAASRLAGYSLEVLTDELVGRRKAPMKELFGEAVLKKDGTPGKTKKLAPVAHLQQDPLTRDDWIQYSAYDSQAEQGRGAGRGMRKRGRGRVGLAQAVVSCDLGWCVQCHVVTGSVTGSVIGSATAGHVAAPFLFGRVRGCFIDGWPTS